MAGNTPIGDYQAPAHGDRDLQLRSRWLEEDGGSYRKSDGRELLSRLR